MTDLVVVDTSTRFFSHQRFIAKVTGLIGKYQNMSIKTTLYIDSIWAVEELGQYFIYLNYYFFESVDKVFKFINWLQIN